MKNDIWRYSFLLAFVLLFSGCSPDSGGNTEHPQVNIANSSYEIIITRTTTPVSIPSSISATSLPIPTRTPQPKNTPVYFSGAGDISICGQLGDDQTAAILINQVGSGLYFSSGDSSNENGTLYEYQNCFGPSWGQLMPDLRVVPGNHDYYSDPMQNYWIFFDGLAGEPGQGWYSFDHGDWHIVMLNSNCGYVECGASSEQIAWLKQDLDKNDTHCSMAIWHHPRFNSGIAGNADWLYTFWDVLYEYGVDVVVNGHDHHYERMAKINPQGESDRLFGIRSFIVGTGGAGFYGIDQVQPFSEVRILRQFGIIQFELEATKYSWNFINIDGEILDQGTDNCSPNQKKFDFIQQ